MKKLLIIFLCFSVKLSAQNVYYVSPAGSDGNPGTLASPWATLQKAFDEADAGDTVYFRGGTYYFTTVSYHNPGVTGEGPGHGHNGTYAAPICFFNYPGEVPIFDFSLHTSTTDATGFDVRNSTYLKFKGLTIQHEEQVAQNQWKASMLFGGATSFRNGNIYLDQIVCRSGGGYGIWCIGWDTLSVINCDSYNHFDSNDTDPGNTADGFTIGSGTTTPDSTNLLVFYGNRSWGNSDDAFEISPACEVDVHDNWSFLNGWRVYPSVGHNSFKVQQSAVIKLPAKRKFYKNLCVWNNGYVFDEVNLTLAAYGPVQSYLNNTIFSCKSGFGSNVGSFNCATGYAKTIIRNNIVYKSWYGTTYDQSYLSACAGAYATVDHNTWRKNANLPYWEYNPDVSWSYSSEDAQFAALPADSAAVRTLMTATRKADGSLPDLGDYFQLAPTSLLIDAGTDVGYGNDIGAFQYSDAVSTATDILSFTFADQVGVSVINATTHTITAVLQAGEDITAITPTFTLSSGATSDPVSGAEDDYTNPVTITVTAEDAVTEQEWTVTITEDDEPVPTVATVATTSASYTATRASVTGVVYSANGGTLTARGICWSASASPTVADSHTTDNPALGSFTDIIYGLSGGTTLNVRAYATTSEGGTSYGDNITFTTKPFTVIQVGGKIERLLGKTLIMR